MSGKAGQLTSSAWIESSQRAPIIWFAGLWINQTLVKSIHIVRSKTNLDLREKRVLDYSWSYKLSVLQFLSSRGELGKGPLFGTAVWWEVLYSWLLTLRPPARSPPNLLGLKTLLLALCFLLHTFPQGHYKAECPAWSHLNVYPQAWISLNWLAVWEHHSQSRVALTDLKECYQSIS